jgi:hypothetical protein
MKTTQYKILSPDGISIEFNKTYNSIIEAYRALINFKNQYKKQGFYSSNDYGHIHLDDLRDYCELIEI